MRSFMNKSQMASTAVVFITPPFKTIIEVAKVSAGRVRKC